MRGGLNALLFTGTYEHTIDAKQRLALPAEVRNLLNPKQDGDAFYATVIEGPTLALYTEAGFRLRAEQLDQSDLPPEQVLAYEQVIFSLARRVEMDKQGRVRLPEQLLKLVELDRDVVLIGVKDHLQVHDRNKWAEHIKATLTQRQDLMMNPRRLLHKRSTPNP